MVDEPVCDECTKVFTGGAYSHQGAVFQAGVKFVCPDVRWYIEQRTEMSGRRHIGWADGVTLCGWALRNCALAVALQ